MAFAIVTVKIMPVSPEVDLEALQKLAMEKIVAFAGEGDTKVSIEPIAFGLKALNIIFVMDEKKGSPDVVADQINELEDVNSAEISDVRRAIG
ncbi:MAG: elongation factor 1-beta [archaeon]